MEIVYSVWVQSWVSLLLCDLFSEHRRAAQMGFMWHSVIEPEQNSVMATSLTFPMKE